MKLRRIFALVPDCHVTGWRYAAVWRKHFYEGLVQAGLSIVLPRNVDFGWARPPQSVDMQRTAGARARTSERLLSQIISTEGGPPQAVFSCCFSHDVELELVDRVRAAGIPWVNFFCDSLYAFDRVSALGSRTSLNWFVESAAEERYRALGVPCLRAPYALNPEHLPDSSCNSPDRALLFVGAANRHRLRTVALLRLARVDLHLRGWGWNEALAPPSAGIPVSKNPFKRLARSALRWLLAGRTGGYLNDDTMCDELRSSAVVLGLNEGGAEPNAPHYLKLRDLEFPGMGCCCLTQHHTDLAEIFELGPAREIVTFRTPAEAARLANELARHPAECRAIGQRARTRVLAEHTWSTRLAQIESRL